MNSKFGTQFALKLLKSTGKLGFLGLIGSQSCLSDCVITSELPTIHPESSDRLESPLSETIMAPTDGSNLWHETRAV